MDKLKVLAIATQKGGVGKSTTALEVASALAIDQNYKVLLIDFDQQCNLTKYVNQSDVDSGKTIYDVLHDPKSIKECIRVLKAFDFIASSSELSKSDIEFNDSDDIFLLDDAFDNIKEDYDFVVIDNGPQRNKLLTMVYVAADYVIAPCDDTEGGSDGLINVYNDIEKLRNARVPLSDAEIMGVIITRFKGNTNINKAAVEILTNAMKQINPDGFVLTARDSVKASEAKYARKPIQEFAPYSTVAIDYRMITDNIVDYINKKGDK